MVKKNTDKDAADAHANETANGCGVYLRYKSTSFDKIKDEGKAAKRRRLALHQKTEKRRRVTKAGIVPLHS